MKKINIKKIATSIKKNKFDFIVPVSFSLYAYLFGLDFKLEWHKNFFIFGIYIFPILILLKIIFDAVKMGDEDSE